MDLEEEGHPEPHASCLPVVAGAEAEGEGEKDMLKFNLQEISRQHLVESSLHLNRSDVSGTML